MINMKKQDLNFMQDNLDFLFSDTFEDTEKPFNNVFRIDKSHGEVKLFPVIPSKIDNYDVFNQDKIIVIPSVQLQGQLLENLTDKILVGKIHKFNGIFYITSFK
jgi:dihydrofolate reductase